jgi:hypothetical protein
MKGSEHRSFNLYLEDLPLERRSRDNPIGAATSYRLDDFGSIPGSARFFSSPQRPDRL